MVYVVFMRTVYQFCSEGKLDRLKANMSKSVSQDTQKHVMEKYSRIKKMRTGFTTLTLGALFALPAFAYGAGVDYVSLVESREDTVKLKRSTLSSEIWYQCSVTTLQCDETASTTPLTTSSTTPATNTRPP